MKMKIVVATAIIIVATVIIGIAAIGTRAHANNEEAPATVPVKGLMPEPSGPIAEAFSNLFGCRSYDVTAAESSRSKQSENKQTVAMSELPTPVQKTIQDNLGGETVTETAKETKDGRTYFEAHVQKAGGEKVEMKVAEDGKLLGVDREDDDDCSGAS